MTKQDGKKIKSKLKKKIPYYIKRSEYFNHCQKAIEDLHNVYSGKRCFIIGNGPSLTIDDLNNHKNEYSFASNKIFLAFDSTSWRPNFYNCEDHLVFK